MDNAKTNKILDAAIKIFAEKGYQYATIAEIAKEAGISTGLVYSYFENKLDLLLSAMLLFFQKVNELNQKKLSKIKNPVDKLHAVFMTFPDILMQDTKSLYWGSILKEGFPQPHLVKSKKLQKKQTEIYEQNNNILRTIDEIIIEGQKKGVIDSAIKAQVVRQILGGTSQTLFNGLFLQHYRNEEAGYDEGDIKNAIATLIKKFTTM
jgi:TetR/AcrR family fatty acid metabolism transcriptional regulator